MGADCSRNLTSCSWFRKRKYRGLMLGLSYSGRTTLLYNMKYREILSGIPTIGFNVEEFTFPTFKLSLYDIGGGDKLREVDHMYY